MDNDNTLAARGQISKVRQFLTPDYDFGDHDMAGFAQIKRSDTIGNENIDERVYNFVDPLISLSRENAVQV